MPDFPEFGASGLWGTDLGFRRPQSEQFFLGCGVFRGDSETRSLLQFFGRFKGKGTERLHAPMKYSICILYTCNLCTHVLLRGLVRQLR